MSAKKVSAAAKNSSLLPKLSKAPLIVSQDLQEIPQPGRSTCTCNFIVWACDKNLKSVNFRTYIAYTTFTRGLDRCVTVTKRVRSISTKAKIISTTRENLMAPLFFKLLITCLTGLVNEMSRQKFSHLNWPWPYFISMVIECRSLITLTVAIVVSVEKKQVSLR